MRALARRAGQGVAAAAGSRNTLEGSGINPGELAVRVRQGPPAAHQDLCAYEDGRDGVQLDLGC